MSSVAARSAERAPSGTQGVGRAVSMGATVIGLGLLLSGCQMGVLAPRGPIGAAENTILFNSLAIMLTIVVPTIVATVVFAWWFRASNSKAKYRPTFAYSGQLELVVWSIPLLVIMFLGGIAWISSHDLDPARVPDSGNKPLNVQVVSLDWKWLFIYPDQGVAAVNQLVMPAGRPVRFSLTSASVMNAFFIPQLGSMIYTMNGMTDHLLLQADQEGTFAGLSSHFSGDGFPGMHFDVRAVAPDAFEAWVQTTKTNGPTLDRAAYADLSRQSFNVAPSTFHSVEPGLFEDIATQKLPPAPGPDTSHPSQTISPKAGG